MRGGTGFVAIARDRQAAVQRPGLLGVQRGIPSRQRTVLLPDCLRSRGRLRGGGARRNRHRQCFPPGGIEFRRGGGNTCKRLGQRVHGARRLVDGGEIEQLRIVVRCDTLVDGLEHPPRLVDDCVGVRTLVLVNQHRHEYDGQENGRRQQQADPEASPRHVGQVIPAGDQADITQLHGGPPRRRSGISA